MFLATYALWKRDVVRFYRQRSRIIGALGTPLIFWVLLGSGLGTSFRIGSTDVSSGGYLEYFYPGALALILLFTAIFSTISVIEDRHEGFLQGVLVAPVPRATFVLGKILGGSTLAVLQAGFFLLLASFANVEISWAALPLLLLALTALAVALTGLGFILAWILDSTQGFHAIMNLLLFPMWILSGAVFPASGAAGWIRGVMQVNPMTYGVAAIRSILGGAESASDNPSVGGSLIFIALFGITTVAIGVWIVNRRT